MNQLSPREIYAYLDEGERGYHIVRRAYARGGVKSRSFWQMPCEHEACLDQVIEKILDKFQRGVGYKGFPYYDYSHVRASLRKLTYSFFDGARYSHGIKSFCMYSKVITRDSIHAVSDLGSSVLDLLASNERVETIWTELFSVRGCTYLYLHCIENKSYREIAEIKRVTMNMVGSKIHRARIRLFRRLLALGIVKNSPDARDDREI